MRLFSRARSARGAAIDCEPSQRTRWKRGQEALRHSRTRWISRASHALGAVIQLEHPLATASRDLALRLTPGFLSDLTMRPLFSFRG